MALPLVGASCRSWHHRMIHFKRGSYSASYQCYNSCYGCTISQANDPILACNLGMNNQRNLQLKSHASHPRRAVKFPLTLYHEESSTLACIPFDNYNSLDRKCCLSNNTSKSSSMNMATDRSISIDNVMSFQADKIPLSDSVKPVKNKSIHRSSQEPCRLTSNRWFPLVSYPNTQANQPVYTYNSNDALNENNMQQVMNQHSLATETFSLSDSHYFSKQQSTMDDKYQNKLRNTSKEISSSAPLLFDNHYFCDQQSATEDKNKLNDSDKVLPSPAQLELVMERLSFELPDFFTARQSYNIYSDNIVFDNKLLNVKIRGLKSYRIMIATLKGLCRVYCCNVAFDVLKMTKHHNDGTIRVRWRIVGFPRHQVALLIWPFIQSPKCRYFDCFSTLRVGINGLVNYHRLDKVTPSDYPETAQRNLWLPV